MSTGYVMIMNVLGFKRKRITALTRDNLEKFCRNISTVKQFKATLLLRFRIL